MNLIKTKKLNNNVILKPHSEADLQCSSYIDFSNPKYVCVDGGYYSSILIINYSREMEELFLDRIMSLDIDVQISMLYEKKDSYEVIKELTYSIGNSGATIKTSNENQQDIDILGNKYSDAKYIRKQLQVGEENLFYLILCLGTYANNTEDLENNLQRIESYAVSAGLTPIRANYRQEQALKALMPLVKFDKSIQEITARNVLTSGLVSSYPFVSNELFDEKGILIGTNSFDKSIILLDRFDTNKYKNANMFVVGTSGSGKSYFTKLMISRNRFLNIIQFVIDPDREYTSLCKKLSGSIVKFGSDGNINPFDIRETFLEKDESYLKTKIAKLNIFFSFIFENMDSEEKTLLEEKIIECYKKRGITEDNESLFEENEKSKILRKKRFKNSEEMPKMEDLFELLKKDKRLKKYAQILKPYVSGSLSFFNNYTSIDTNNKLVIVDVHDIGEDTIPLVMFVVTDYFWDVIKSNKNDRKILYLDEVWKLINKNQMSAEFVFKMFKTIRKFGGGATAITQDVSDFFMLDEGKYGKGIINNSSTKCIFQLEENDIETLEKTIKISDEEKYRLLNMKRGTAIIHAGRNTIMADIVASQKEHDYISTDICEIGG